MVLRFCRVALLVFLTVGLALPAQGAKKGHAPAGAEGGQKTAGEAHGGGHAADTDLGHANAGAQLEDPSEWQYDLAIYTFVVFLLLLAILWKFAWGPIAAGLEKREKGIADNIAAAQKAAEEAKRLTAEYEARLADAGDEIRRMLDGARKDAEAARQEIVEDAREKAAVERDRAVREIELATDKALEQLAQKSADMAVELAGKIVQAELSPADHAALIRQAVAKFPLGKPSDN